MSEKDGKADLVSSKKDKGYFILETNDEFYQENLDAANDCPVKIIKVEKK